jgi:hypothetical protein
LSSPFASTAFSSNLVTPLTPLSMDLLTDPHTPLSEFSDL